MFSKCFNKNIWETWSMFFKCSFPGIADPRAHSPLCPSLRCWLYRNWMTIDPNPVRYAQIQAFRLSLTRNDAWGALVLLGVVTSSTKISGEWASPRVGHAYKDYLLQCAKLDNQVTPQVVNYVGARDAKKRARRNNNKTTPFPPTLSEASTDSESLI